MKPIISIMLCLSLSLQSFAHTPSEKKESDESKSSWTLSRVIGTSFFSLLAGVIIKKLFAPETFFKKNPEPKRGNSPHGGGSPFFFSGNGHESYGRLKISPDMEMKDLQKKISISSSGEVQNQGTSTGVFRYPNLILHLLKQPKNMCKRTIYIMGPGLSYSGTRIPQLHELMPFFENDNIIVVDISENVLNAITRSCYNQEAALSILNIESNFLHAQPKRRSNICTSLLEYLDTVPQSLPSTLATIQSNFADLHLEEESIDVMVGTISISYAMVDMSSGQQFEFIKRIFRSLKKGGTLYIDKKAADYMLARFHDFELNVEVLPCLSANNIDSCSGILGFDSDIPGLEATFVTTHILYAITRLAK